MASGQRPLSEISPVAPRRNSPGTKGFASGDSSPFDSSPMNTSTSPRLFWQGRDPASPYRVNFENRSPYDGSSPASSAKRSSIENLKKASRVKNSSMFAREQKGEYDPAHVKVLERPLASGRPLSQQRNHNIATNTAPTDARRQLPSQSAACKTTTLTTTTHEAETNASQEAATPRPAQQSNNPSTSQGSPSRPQPPSPPKSSLNKNGRYSGRSFDPHSEIWSDDESTAIDKSFGEGRSFHRQTKSVTFDAAPPQINEYEMTTPVPSSIASSSREGSYESTENEESFDASFSLHDDSFDASLEDTDKTPVMLPDQWRYDSPDDTNDEMSQNEYDPFSPDFDTPDPEARPPSSSASSSFRSQIESMDSNGECRPLPPLPLANLQRSPDHHRRLTATLERASSVSRPAPLRPASCSKDDLSGLGTGSLSLEDRLRLMMTQEHDHQASEAETQRERRMRRALNKDKTPERTDGKPDDSIVSELSMSSEPCPTPRISRESILRNLKREENFSDDVSGISSIGDSSPHRPLPLDPDVPIPSLESDDVVEDHASVKEEEQDEIDLYDIPEYDPEQDGDDSTHDGHDQGTHGDYDDESHYSRTSKEDDSRIEQFEDAERQSTPVPMHITQETPADDSQQCSPSRSQTPDDEHQFELDLLSYVDRSTPPIENSDDAPPPLDMAAIRDSLHRPETPDQNTEQSAEENDGDKDCPGTPESVIRHRVSEDAPEEPAAVIPGPLATVKAPGAGLKTRPSLTPADAESMAAVRRKVSGQGPRIPSISENATGNRPSTASELTLGSVKSDLPAFNGIPGAGKRQPSLVKLDIPVGDSDEGLGFGLDEEFDRVIEAQKVAFELSLSQIPLYKDFQNSGQPMPRAGAAEGHGSSTLETQVDNKADRKITKQRGYLMRQNTKVIVATSHGDEANAKSTAGAPHVGSTPRKASQQTWTTEPWNPKARRQSIKLAGATKKKTESVPPLPGQESVVKDGLGSVDETDVNGQADDMEDGKDRGRLFVKVVGVKDLDLPLPRGERSFFSLTLDNGLHCVTTSWLELGKSAPIGQEFELVVMNELEFQLTLQIKPELLKPKPKVVPPSPPKAQKPQKTSAFSRVFATPKKRREMELRQQMEAQQLKQKAEEEIHSAPDPWAKVRNLVASDGSFARAYVCLGDYEQHAFGRPLTVDVACFNEWAVDEVPVTTSNSKSKRNTMAPGVQRRPPYMVGNLELQLLYVPKPKGATDDDMPKSMNACIREMRDADNSAMRSWEGFLSQQGGDCPYWRRRYFKLQGSKLTAYHETTRQPRATINLAKASKLIDDRSILTQRETSAKGGGRRKSAFAEEEEGYMFVEEGFRIRFGNGEVIDFYADSRVEKEGWMGVLGETVGKGYSAGNGQVKAWTELVLRRERSVKPKQPQRDMPSSERPMSARNPMPPAPPTPAKDTAHPHSSRPPMAPPPKPRHKHHQSQPNISWDDARRQKARSLIF
ncbi:GTP binding protein [Coccidioides immitis RS]|uniref:GTP binding protein n=2 Tax=Coccidioides immitis TaxID=5501 RepID=A0A0E1S021_COCIM|nr:GTP binding protein [Coccidioides immitis RS]EAS35493.2 GTP binding protein [Coccidioides immitis RS]